MEKLFKALKANHLYNKAIRLEETKDEIAREVGMVMGTERTREEDIQMQNKIENMKHLQSQIRDIMHKVKQMEREIFDN